MKKSVKLGALAATALLAACATGSGAKGPDVTADQNDTGYVTSRDGGVVTGKFSEAGVELRKVRWGIVIPFVFASPYAVFLLRQSFRQIPQELIDAADPDDRARQFANLIEGAPSGGEEDYVVLRHEGGQPRDFAAEGFEPADHLAIGEGLDIIDTRRGAKVSGARFYYLKGWGMRLELALMTAALDAAVAHGFTPMTTPTLVTPQVMGGTGFLGAHSDEIYYLPADDLYLTGTSEVALAGYHADEILDLSAGPKRYMGWSTCYRREAGAAGKDTRGIIRVHQFNKAEMFSYCRPEDAEAEHARLLAMEEEMLALVELPYRVIDTAAGDLGSSAARKFDCEAWLPTQQRYMEVTSTSNCTTFQARRLGIRERREDGMAAVATLNGTLATTRWIVAFLENHQQADGSVRVPTGLRPYLGGLEVIEPVGVTA